MDKKEWQTQSELLRMTIEERLEHYKKILNSIVSMLPEFMPKHKDIELVIERLKTKAECYRAFISDLEQLIAKEKNRDGIMPGTFNCDHEAGKKTYTSNLDDKTIGYSGGL